MAASPAKTSFPGRVLGGAVTVAGVAALGVAVALAIVWLERPWQVLVVSGVGALGGLGLAYGVLLYLGHASREHLAGTAALVTAAASGLVIFWVTGLAQHQIKGWPGWPFHLGFGLGIVGLVVVAVRHQIAWTERVALAMKGYRPASVALLRPGETARVRGLVREASLKAPVSGKPCAAWTAEVLGLVNENDWIILGSAKSGAAFQLVTDQGTVRIDAPQALFARGTSQSQLGVAALPEVLRAAVEGHAFFSSCRRLEVRELCIDLGAQVSVLGTVKPDGSMGERNAGELLIDPERGS